MNEEFEIRCIRILLIINKFSENSIFKSELKLQKLDFFMRNLDHFVYYLLSSFKKFNFEINIIKAEIDFILKDPLFKSKRLEMKKFKYGAYEELDSQISYLRSLKLLDILGINPKIYKITEEGEIFLKELERQENFEWYFKIVEILYKYFKNTLPTDLKNIQYSSDKYLNAKWNETIKNEFDKVKNLYKDIFQEEIIL